MRYRKLTADEDYTFGNGQLDFYRDEPAAVGQAVLTRLLLFLGEWYLDITAGTPYLQGILGKHSKQEADTTIQAVVLGTTTDDGSTLGVTDIPKYESEINADTRGMNVQLSVDTIYGPTAVQIANYENY